MEEGVHKKLDTFFGKFKKRSYKKGEILIRSDDNPQGIFYLTSGLVRMYAISKKGEEVVVNLYRPVSFFPMISFFSRNKNRYYFEATEETQVRLAPKEKVLTFLKKNPDVVFDLLSRVYRGMDGLLLRTAYLMGSNAYGRLITEILIMAKRFGTKKDGIVEVMTSEKDLATYTGMTRETVSRELSLLKKNGLLDFTRHSLHIKDMEKLEEELEDDI